MSNSVIHVPEGEGREQALILDGPASIEVAVERGGRAHIVLVVAGEGGVECTVKLTGAGAEADIYALWIAAGDKKPRLTTRMEHSVPDCRSFQMVKGIASGTAAGKFTGEIYVAPDAQRTVALQQSRNLLLGDQARITTEPQLEIYADDVKCSHGATVGQMDDQAVFYMRQRGLSDDQARRLQIEGFANDILSRIADPAVREQAERLVQEKL
jgi:Fe-S cluster assembly protein SufD